MSDIDYSMPIRSPQEAVSVYKSEFDAAWEYGGLMVAVWHQFVSGRLARWQEAVRFIEYMQAKGAVWFATLEQIAAHIEGVHAQTPDLLRIEQMPPYAGPVAFDRY